MAGFGGWLNESKLNLTEIATLRRSAVNLEGWPNIRSDNIGEYADVLQRIPCHQTKIAALDALYKLWSLYETQKKQAKSGVSATGWIVAGIAGLLRPISAWEGPFDHFNRLVGRHSWILFWPASERLQTAAGSKNPARGLSKYRGATGFIGSPDEMKAP
jgi:hypothetical protein